MRHFSILGTQSWSFHRVLSVIIKEELSRQIAIRFISKLWIAQNLTSDAVSLSSKKLRQEFGPLLPQVARKLEEVGYLETTSYKVGHYCKQYRLTEQMTRFKFEILGEHEKAEGLLERELSKCQLPAVHRSILSNSERTRFDVEGAKRLLKETPFTNQSAKNWRENFIELIERSDWPPFKIDAYGRFHYFWTATPRDLRRFFSAPNGERLVHIDVVSAQLCFHISLYPQESPEKQRFIEICQSGAFWELMNRELGYKFDLSDHDSKGALKKGVFQDILYALRTYQSDFTRAFSQVFPELLELIIEARLHRRSNKLPHIATEMQELESRVVINTAIKAILERNQEAYVCSLHDCVICTEDLKETVREAVSDAFQEHVGFVPMLKEEAL